MYEENDVCLWLSGRSLDEELFCQELMEYNNLVYVGGHFYSEQGLLSEPKVRRMIYEQLRRYVRTNIGKKVDSLLHSLKIVAARESLDEDDHTIHIANGTFDIYTGYREEYRICRHRLPVRYLGDQGQPEQWLEFLNALLEPEDILTLQEYMGYCLIPTNRAQRMLIILGNGGEGKSRIGVVMKAIFGEGMHISSLPKLEGNAFARADLENLLVMVDDDLRLDALSSTNYIKSIISADVAMDVERKFEQSYQTKLHARLMAFGNGSLEALHDRSYGFFRRQIILSAKPRNPDRVDDPYLGDSLAMDKDRIFRWCLMGLYRLVQQDFRFTISEKTRQNWLHTVNEQNNVVGFMASKGYFRHEESGAITARRFYELYRLWCDDNALKPLSQKSFSSYLIANQHSYGIRYSNNVPMSEGKMARGFKGILPHTVLSAKGKAAETEFQ